MVREIVNAIDNIKKKYKNITIIQKSKIEYYIELHGNVQLDEIQEDLSNELENYNLKILYTGQDATFIFTVKIK